MDNAKNTYKWKILEYTKDYKPPKNTNLKDLYNLSRLQEFQELTLINVSKINTDIVAFKCNNTIYSYVYYINDNPEFICCSPSLISMDGEYRRRFIQYNQFTCMYIKYAEIFDEIEAYIKLSKINLVAYINNDTEVDTELLPLQLYSLSFIINHFHTYNKTFENHVNKTYITTMILDKDKIFYVKLIEKYGQQYIKNTINHFTSYFIKPETTNNPVRFILGQKLTPLNIKDLREWGNITHPIWRELYCNKRLNNLIINNVYMGISIYVGWFVIKNDIHLFDNESMHDKLHQSNRIKEIIATVREQTEQVSVYDTLMKEFNKPIDLAETRIIMSEYAICYISEYLERTFMDIPHMLKTIDYVRKIGDMYNDEHLYKRYIFDILHGLLACNTVGIIHGDLHLNNCTIKTGLVFYKLIDGEVVLIETLKAQPHSQVTIEDKAGKSTTYLLPFNGAYSSLIDFSRAIITPTNEELSGVDDLREAVLFVYEQYFPDIYKQHKHKLELVSLQCPVEVFHLLTIYDVYVFSTKMQTLTKQTTTNPKIIAFIDDLVHTATTYLTDDMMRLFDTKYKIEYPIVDIMHKFYKNYESTNYKPEGEIFMYNTIKLSGDYPKEIEIFDTYPSYLKELLNIFADIATAKIKRLLKRVRIERHC